MTALQVIWFFLVGVLLFVYSILDGFDLGTGFWSLFVKEDKDKRVLLNAVGPVWDGNEVWLLTGGGALFAAFPHVYATVFSGFYLALMLVLFSLIVRAVSFEFRSKVESDRWRKLWDAVFGYSSTIPALLYGVALGNILRGIPLDKHMGFTGNFFTLLNPYALLIGLTGFAMLATHGGIWIMLKASGELEQKAKSWTIKAWWAYLILFILSAVLTFVFAPDRLNNFKAHPVLWIIPVLALVFIVLIKVYVSKEEAGKAFLFSALSIAGMWGIVGASLFPTIVPAINDPNLSLTIMNSSSSELTLKSMLIIALLGVPIVLAYTIWIYKTFWGKIEPEHEVY